ncbi:MAG: hypothetical protein ABI459_11610, partial [Deltaproteobacteria bacterium]
MDENFDWAIRTGFLTSETPLVLPTRDFFPSKIGKSPEAIQAVVNDIARLLGLEGRTIEVAPLDLLPGEYRHSYQQLSLTAGTWQADENHALIRYDPELAARPLVLIATLVHELMHEKLSWIADQPPGGAAAHELATDLHCITCGFGVIAMNAAEQIGWQGYMRQPTRAYAVAQFSTVRGLDIAEVLSNLAPRSAAFVKRALITLKDCQDVTLLANRLA